MTARSQALAQDDSFLFIYCQIAYVKASGKLVS